MAETLDELMVRIDANVTGLMSGFSKAQEKSEASTKAIEKHLEHMNEGFKEVGKIALEFAAIIGIKVGVEAFKEFIVGSFEAVSAMAEMSQQLGINIDQLYGLKVAAAESGVSFETVTSAMSKMSNKISEASTGTFEANRAFRDLNLSSKELAELTPDEAFAKIADATQSVGNHMDRTRILMDLFGRAGAQMGNLLAGGSAGLEEATDKAKALGITVSHFDAENIRKVKDNFELLHGVIGGLGTTIAAKLSPILLKATEYLIDLSKDGHTFGETVTTAVNGIISSTKFLLNMWMGFKIIFKAVEVGFFAFSETLNTGLAKVVKSHLVLFGLIKNLGTILVETAKTGQAGFEVASAAIKYAFAVVFQYLSEKLGDLMRGVADVAARVAPEISDHFLSAANGIAAATGSMGADAEKKLKSVSQAAADQSTKMRESLSNVFDIGDVDNNPLVKYFTEGAAKAKDFRNEALDDLSALTSQELPSKAIDDWADHAIGKYEEVKEAGRSALDDEYEDALISDNKKKHLDAQLANFTEYLDAQVLAEMQNNEDRKNAAQELFENKKIDEQQKNQILQGIEEDHQQALRDIEAKSILDRKGMFTKELQNRVSTAGAMFGQLATLAQSGNKRLIAIGKAARVAETIMNTAAAAMAGWNQGMQQGGPYLGAAYAAIAIAAGAVQLSTINSVNSGGGGSIGGVGGSGNVAAQDNKGQGIQNKQDAAQIVNLQVNDDSMGKGFIIGIGKALDRAIREDGLKIGGFMINGGTG